MMNNFIIITFTLFACISSYAQNNNCSAGVTICNNSSFSSNSGGFGIQELTTTNRGCLIGNEHQSSWYYFSPTTTGTIAFTIVSNNVDYDFAIWGPASTTVCPPNTTPLRCSYAGGTGNTGLGNGAIDVSEGSGGDRWVAPLTIGAPQVNQVYVLLIDNFTANNTPFSLSWTGTAVMNCTPLPIELLNFSGKKKAVYNAINWSTASERNNSYFTIERSAGDNWEIIATKNGSLESYSKIDYQFEDYNYVRNSINYYRLSQTDIDNKKVAFDHLIFSVDNRNSAKTAKTVKAVYNLMGQKILIDSPGFILIHYEDGTTERKFNP